MKESNHQDFGDKYDQAFVEENKKTSLKEMQENQLVGIIKYLEPTDILNFRRINKSIKNYLDLDGKNTSEATKKVIFESLCLPLIKNGNGIGKIISLEKYADILFGEIIKPFVSKFYQDDFSKLDYDAPQNRRRVSVLSFMCFETAPDACQERIMEMLRYVVFIKLIELISSDKLIESVCKNLEKKQNETWVDYYKNIIINYLNSDSVVVDIRRFLNGPNHRGANRWVYMFAFNLYNLLEQKFPENAVNKDKEKEIVCMLLKFITSRLVHLEKPSEKFCEEAVYYLITHFCLAYGGRFLTNPKEFASYLNETGDAEQLLFSPKIDFINLFYLLPNDNHDYSKEYGKYLKTESAKACLYKMLIMADYRKSKCEKITTLAGYYGLYKWVAVAKDTFNSLYDGCTRAKDFLKIRAKDFVKTNFGAYFDTCFCTRCKKRRSESNLNLNINLNQNENIPLLDNNNQENNHEHQE